MNKLPQYTHRYFWDVNPEKLEKRKDYYFIVERLLEYADDRTIRWLLKNFSDDAIIKVVKKSRKLSPKTICFWQNYYSLKEEEILCLKEYCRQNNSTFWNY